MEDTSYDGFLIGVAVSLLTILVFIAGVGFNQKEVLRECKTFKAFVINGEKFRCELVEE